MLFDDACLIKSGDRFQDYTFYEVHLIADFVSIAAPFAWCR
ncbi:MAG: hypothetical protein ACR2LR_01050 [Hassallia sp.]